MRAAIGLPTIVLRPMTTHSAPAVATPYSPRSNCTPAAVHGTKPSVCPISSLPTLTGWKPSTSLSGRMWLMTVSGSICFGSGICTRIPSTVSSALSCSTSARSSACDVVDGSRIVSPAIPASRDAFSLPPTYTALAGSSPTSTTVRPGVTPFRFSSATSAATSARTFCASATPSINRAPPSAMPDVTSVPATALSGKIHRPCLSNQHDFDLPWILELGLDAPRDLLGERRHAHVVHVIRDDHHPDLAAGLDGEHAFHSLVARGDALEPLEPLHVRLERLAARAWTGAGDRVGRLHQHGHLALVGHVVVVGRDAVHYEWMLPVLRRHLHPELDVRALVFVRQHLAHVVQQRATLGDGDVQSQLRSHDARKVGDFLRVLKDVLAVARAPLHPPDELDELRMEAVHTGVVRRLLACLDDLDVDFLLRLVDDLLDPAGVNPTVRHELLERQARHLAANRIEAGHHHGVRRVVDDDVHAGGELERADVAALASDDAPFHLVVR